MKRSGFKQKPRKPLKRSYFKKKVGSGRVYRKTLKNVSKSTVACLKRDIQALLRQNVIKRDGGCVLRHYPEAGNCGGYRKDGELILQAEHLNSRASSASYGELENIVCLCINHHLFFKKRNGILYWDLIRKHIGEERWSKVQAWIRDKTAHHMGKYEWEQVKLLLENKLKELQQ